MNSPKNMNSIKKMNNSKNRNSINKMNNAKINMHIFRNIFATVMMSIICIIGMSGCQLATENEEGGALACDHKLIGVMVTVAPLTEQKIYGEMYKEDGGTKVRFDVKDAITVFEIQGNDMTDLDYDEYFEYTKVEISNNETDTTLEKAEKHILNLYYDEELEGEIIYFNGIYVDDQDKIYVTDDGMGQMISPYSHNLNITKESATTETEDGQSVQQKYIYSINVIRKEVCDKVVVRYMSGESQEISKQEYTLDAYPTNISTPEGTDYIIVEKTNGTEVGERELIDIVEDAYLTFIVYSDGENGFVKPHVVTVNQ